jgi:hypothetical protein
VVEIRSITVNQAKDTAMAIVLIFLIATCYDIQWTLWVAMALLAVNMIWPALFKPAAFLWCGAADLLRLVSSNIILGAIFAFLVVPVGLVRKMMGKDALNLKAWKKSEDSVFKIRDHKYSAEDLEYPY